ncbi:MAG: hypothetical protein Q9159_001679 [Coniocarpon cinnabarinum]
MSRLPSLSEVSETITPDSTKSEQQKLKEGATDVGDKLGRSAQSDDSKSTTQKISDKTGRSKDEHEHGGTAGGITDTIKNATGLGDKK